MHSARTTLLHGLAGFSLFFAACSGPPAPPHEPAFALTDASVPAAESPAPRAEEELAYSIELAGLPVGHATMATRQDESGWQVEVEGGTNSLVDFFYSVHGVARSRIGTDGRSRAFYLCVDEGGKATERALSYDGVPCLYYHPPDQEPWMAQLSQWREPGDPIGLLLALRDLDPSAHAHDFEVAMTLRSYCYRARCMGREDLRTDAGTFERALVWRIEVRAYRELGATTEVGPITGFYTLFLSADARRLPLRLEREFGFGQIALELEKVGVPARSEPALKEATTLARADAPKD